MPGYSPPIRSLQRGTQSINNTDTSYAIGINAVEVANAFALGGTWAGERRGVRVNALASTQLTLARGGGVAIAFVVPWLVVERY